MTSVLERLTTLMETQQGDDLPPLTDELVSLLDLPADLPERLTITEVSELTGVSADTLRYYEKARLIRVPRTPGGHRSFDRDALGRVIFVTRLRMADMPIRDIEHYIRLVDAGPETVPERLALLQQHRARMERELRDRQLALAVVDYKIRTYGGDTGPSKIKL